MFAAHQGVVCETPHLRLAVSSNHVVKRTYSLFQRTRAKVTSWLSEAAGQGSNSRSVLQPHQQHQGKATVPILVEATAPARNASTMADVAVQAPTGRVGRFTRWSPVGLAGGLASVGHVRPLFSSAAMLRTSFAPVQVQIRSMGIFSSSTTEIDRLYDRADDEPDNPVAQAKLLHVLAEEEPEEAIRRFESGQFASNDDCVKAYITALVNTGGLRRANLSKLVAKHVPSAAAPAAAASAHAAPADGPQPISNLSRPVQHAYGGGSGSHRRGSDFGDGSEQEPIVVALQEPSFKAQMWRLIRTIVFVIIFISVINGVFEDRGLGGKSPLTQNEIHPETLKKPTTFEDVQGADEAKDELMDVVEFLRNPDKFTRLGGRLPKGVLLVGPPGTGKTLLARAVAGEAGVPFFYSSGSEFDEMFVGVGARRVRDLFAAAKKKSPCIIFLDEIDAVGGRRSRRDQQFVRMTLNQLLVEMDGFDQNEAVIVIAATNFPEMLDPALTRPGRFDTHIRVPLPDIQGRKKILQTHAKKIPLANEDDLLTIARGTVGFSGAELANLINQAALQASRLHRDVVDLEMLEWAKDKILMGSERKSAVITEKDRRITAFHEAGHALCAIYSEGAHPLYKATIVPRGQALGMVTQLPEDDTNSMSRKQLTARLVVAMGGRAAEEKIFGSDEITTGASSDVEQATRLAHAMVTKYAMSDKVGPVLYRDEDPISDETKLVVEGEVKQLLEGAYKSAKDILSKHEREHHRLAEALLDYETLTADEIRTVIAGKSLSRSKPTLKK